MFPTKIYTLKNNYTLKYEHLFNNPMSINLRLKEVRNYLNLSQVDFADVLEQEQANISRWESGKIKDIPSGIMQILHNKYGININWLLNGSGQMLLNEKPKNNKYIEQRVEDIEGTLGLIINAISINTVKMNKEFELNNEKDEAYQLIEQVKKERPELLIFKRAMDLSKLTNSPQQKKEDKK